MKNQTRFVQILSRIFQSGVFINATLGVSIQALLENQLNLSKEFVDCKVATVFLNGKAVDKIDKALVRKDCEIALSGAMPGFVGATMRRGGYYGTMRQAISYSDDGCLSSETEGLVRIKLYNSLIDPVGLSLAQHGFLITQNDWESLSGTDIKEMPVRELDTQNGKMYLLRI